MKRFFCLFLSLLVFGSLLVAGPDITVSIQEYMDYLDAMQNATTLTAEIKNNSNFGDLFDLKKIEEKINDFFSLDKINKGNLYKSVKENDHSSLLVFFLALGGLAVLVYGYRTLPFLIMIFGAYLGSLATNYIANRFFTLSNNELILTVVLGGLVMAVISLFARTLFVCLFGAVFGAFVTQLILALFPFEITNTLIYLLFAAILFAVIVLLFKRAFMIFLTSFIGSLLLVFASQYIVLEVFKKLSYADQLFNYTSIVIFLITLIAGIFFQFKTTSKA